MNNGRRACDPPKVPSLVLEVLRGCILPYEGGQVFPVLLHKAGEEFQVSAIHLSGPNPIVQPRIQDGYVPVRAMEELLLRQPTL